MEIPLDAPRRGHRERRKQQCLVPDAGLATEALDEAGVQGQDLGKAEEERGALKRTGHLARFRSASLCRRISSSTSALNCPSSPPFDVGVRMSEVPSERMSTSEPGLMGSN